MPPGKNPSYTKLDNEPKDQDDDDDVADHRRAQEVERQKQDENLDELHLAVRRLGDMSLNISTELDTQNKMLDDLSDDTDRAKQTLAIVSKQTQELVKQSGGVKTFVIIVVLVLILLLLTYMVIMT
uniref:t-SNARE coiled-coil homology domain-containing protein n=1 Tax=Peronospora matthiolae TaxID=2874970 RepID=A0AAV1U9E1_9STRA